jgi:tRNA threonylcarbamoyl adenosine modification protein YeaZ
MNMLEGNLDSAIAITLPGPSWARVSAICIDSATDAASLAFIDHGDVVAEQQWRTHFSHTQQLAVRIKGLAAEAEFDLKSVSLVCVCTGPGSFNGIRTGIATAVGLATGLGVPIYGSSALDLLAFPHADRSPAQRAVLPAGRGEHYSALFGTRGGRWRRVSPYGVATLDELVADSPAKCLWCGVLSDDDSEQLGSLLGGARRIVSPPHNVRRAAYLLPLAMAAAASGAGGTPAELQPLYLRHPAISSPRRSLVVGGLDAP